jgi:NTE family protein
MTCTSRNTAQFSRAPWRGRRKVCGDFGGQLREFNEQDDHVYLLVEYPPKVAIAGLVNSLKGGPARWLRSEFTGRVSRHIRHGHLWSPSHFAASRRGAPAEHHPPVHPTSKGARFTATSGLTPLKGRTGLTPGIPGHLSFGSRTPDYAAPMTTAFVLGGGGLLGAHEVGMLRALTEAGIRPDLVVGTSIGAINGAFVAADPPGAVARLERMWQGDELRMAFSEKLWGRAVRLVRSGTHLHSLDSLRRVLTDALPGVDFADLKLPFQCVAASIETASARWFSSGPVVPAVMASCAVPGLLPPVEVDGVHYFDGGLVDSIPVGRAVALGADTVYVLQVGRIESPLAVPTRPWEVGLVAFEIARRHRFHEEMSSLPENVRVHVLPTGGEQMPPGLAQFRYRDPARVGPSIERAYAASARYLAALPG